MFTGTKIGPVNEIKARGLQKRDDILCKKGRAGSSAMQKDDSGCIGSAKCKSIYADAG